MEGFADAEAGGKECGWGDEASGVAMEEDEEREDLQVGAAGEGARSIPAGAEAVAENGKQRRETRLPPDCTGRRNL